MSVLRRQLRQIASVAARRGAPQSAAVAHAAPARAILAGELRAQVSGPTCQSEPMTHGCSICTGSHNPLPRRTTPPGRRRSRSIRPRFPRVCGGCDVFHVTWRAKERTEVMAVIGPPIVLFFQTTHRHHSGTHAGTQGVMIDAWLAVQSIGRSNRAVVGDWSDPSLVGGRRVPSLRHRAPVLPITPHPVVGGGSRAVV